MPSSIVVTLTARQQERILAQLRQARYGHLLRLHILLLLAHGFSPTQIADCLFCSRSSVYRSLSDWRSGAVDLTLPDELPRSWWGSPLSDGIRHRLAFLLRSAPGLFGWMRSRWSCACLALTLSRLEGYRVSDETLRRWLHQAGYVWKRVSLTARDDDPNRVSLLARIRWHWEQLRPEEAFVFADEVDIHLLPKVGSQWTKRGDRVEVVTPGKNQRWHVAAALEVRTGRLTHCSGARKNRFLFLELLEQLHRAYPKKHYQRVYVVADNYGIHTAHDVRRWLEQHPRFVLLWLPRYCPKANPIERVFGDLHDQITRNHSHRTLPPLVAEVEHYLDRRTWQGLMPSIYQEPAIETALRQWSSRAA